MNSPALGMPRWVFWGVFLPWIAVDGIAVWFCYMANDDLGEAWGGDIRPEPSEGGDPLPGARR